MEKKNDGVLYAVYGTLRNGFGNNRLLQNDYVEYMGEERTAPNYKMVSLGGFPGVIPNGEQSILIEVFKVKSPVVERNLDSLEGYPRFYQKMEIETQWGIANMYILSEEQYGKHKIVEGGDWKQFINEKRTSYVS
jgi:gamma-glutamylcyclotransferase (GGCT)/AIG2-like uncharacterized protein YtfP